MKLMYKLFGMAALLLLMTTACKKKTTTTNNNTACNGMNLCFKKNGTLETHNAVWKVLADRYRILWEETNGADYRNIEMDIYTTVPGSYTVQPSPAAGQAGFQYFTNISGTSTNIQGQSGTITISGISGTQISGTFTLSAKNLGDNSVVEFTEGNFVSVPQ